MAKRVETRRSRRAGRARRSSFSTSLSIVVAVVIAFGSRADMRSTMLGAAGCATYLDWPLPVAGVFLATDQRGRATARVQVPRVAGLVGTRGVAQTLIGPTATPPLGLDLSSGLQLTLGN